MHISTYLICIELLHELWLKPKTYDNYILDSDTSKNRYFYINNASEIILHNKDIMHIRLYVLN